MIINGKKSLNKLDLFFHSIHFHIKHLVSETYFHFTRLHLDTIVVFFSELLHNYPCSIVALSLMNNITSNTFIIEQIKSFIHHKKDPVHYLVSTYTFTLSSFNFIYLHLLFSRTSYYNVQLNFKVLLPNDDDIIWFFLFAIITATCSTVIYEHNTLGSNCAFDAGMTHTPSNV